MQKASGNVFLRHLGEWDFHIFITLHLILAVGVDAPNTLKNFCGSCYNIQIEPYANSKMEVFVAKNR